MVFRLVPPVAGAATWSEEILHRFDCKSGGGVPYAGLILDAAGAVYGTTALGGIYANGTGCAYLGKYGLDTGGGCGTVFKLTPATAGQKTWPETVLHKFKGKDGALPIAGLVMDSQGALYGTVRSGGSNNIGAVYSLTPPKSGSGAWKLNDIYTFHNVISGWYPFGGLVRDPTGALYGMTSTNVGGAFGDEGISLGTIFKMIPVGTGWEITFLYSFTGGKDGRLPVGDLVLDKGGALYGVTNLDGASHAGTVFKLVP